MAKYRGYGTDIFVEGRRNQALENRLAVLEQAQTSSTANLVTAPEPCTPSFALSYLVFKGQLRGEFCVNIAMNTSGLKTVIIKDSDCTSQASYETNRVNDETDVDDQSAAAGHFEYRFGPPLEANTLYRLIRLVGLDGQGGRQITEAPLYTDTPLATFTTPAAVNAPSKPSSARIITNTVQTTDDGLIPIVKVRIFANDAETLTFAQQITTQVQCKFEDVDDTAIHPRRTVAIEDNSVDHIDVEVGDLFTLGRHYSWIHNLAWSGEETAIAVPAAPVTFFAGGFHDPSDTSGLTLVSYASATTDDPNTIIITLTLHQPTPPYRLKNYTAKRKVSGRPDADYDLAKNLVVDRADLKDPIYNVAGDIVLQFPMSVNPAKTYVIKTTVRIVGGFTKDFTSGDIAGNGLLLNAATTANSAPPSLATGGSLLASRANYGAAGETDYPGLLWHTTANSGTKINRLATGVGGATIDSKGVQWDDTNGRLKFNTDIFTKGGKPAIRIGKLFQANDIISVCCLWKADTADESQDITIVLVDQGGPTDIASGTMLATNLNISHTAETNTFVVLQVGSSYTLTDKQWIEFRVSSNPAHPIYLRNVQVHYGVLFARFLPNATEQAAIDASGAGGSTASVAYDAGTGVTDFNDRIYRIGGDEGGTISLD